MIYYIILILAFTFQDAHLVQQNIDIILCRTCGNDIAANKYIISKYSSKAYHSFNDTLFNKDNVFVQVFSTDVFFQYPVVTLTHTSCVPTGKWEESTSWFPGYRWKPCICPECGAYIGFVFELINPNIVEPSEPFYALILPSLVGENFLNSLIEYPIDLSL